MSIKMIIQTVIKFVVGVLLVGVLVFLPAGTLTFAGGWLLMGVLFVPMLLVGVVLLIKSPELLKKRLNAKEKQEEQDLIVKLSGLMFVAGFVAAGLDYRFKWLVLPEWVSIAGSVVFVLSYILYAEVLRENKYLSRTVEVQEGQKVVDKGLYGIVRHPMYMSTLVMFWAVPFVLGSLISFAVFAFYPFILVGRINNEERLLENELLGYGEYKKKVKYRLIPFIW